MTSIYSFSFPGGDVDIISQDSHDKSPEVSLSKSSLTVLLGDFFLVSRVNFSLPEEIFCPSQLTYSLPVFRPVKGEGCVCLVSRTCGEGEKEEFSIDWSKNVSKHRQRLKDLSIELKLVFPGSREEAQSLHQKYSSWPHRGRWFLLPAEEKRDLFSFFSEKLRFRLEVNRVESTEFEQNKLCDLRSENFILSQRLEESVAKEKRLAEEIAYLKDELSQRREEIKNIQQTLTKKEARILELEKKNDFLNQQNLVNLRDMSLLREELKVSCRHLLDKDSTISQIQKQNVDLKQEMQSFRRYSSDRESTISQIQKQNVDLKQELQSFRQYSSDRESLLSRIQRENTALGEEIFKQDVKMRKCQQELENLRSYHSISQIASAPRQRVKASKIPDHLESFTIRQLIEMLEEQGVYLSFGQRKSYYIELLRELKAGRLRLY